jgi:prophage antirepressor-like protein
MNTQLQTFNFNSHSLRVITDENGDPWFIAKDVADTLEYSDTNKMTSRLDDDEKSNRQIGGLNVGVGLGPISGGKGITFINESGLYSCILTSKKPEAKAFKKWLTSEVLPSIRKNGSYSIQLPDFSNKIEAAKAWIKATESEMEARALIEIQKETIKNKDDLIRVSNEASVKAGEILIREFVKSQDLITLGEKQFYQWMRDQKIIFSDRNEPYQYYVNAGYFTYKPSEELHGNKFRYTLRVTPRGKVWLAARYMAWIDSASIGELHIGIEKRNGLVLIQGSSTEHNKGAQS